MSRRRCDRCVGTDARPGVGDRRGWLEWLCARIEPAWRPGEWDGSLWLFTGDLDSDRTAAWPCRTPGCPTATRRPSRPLRELPAGPVDGGVCWEEFDPAPPAAARPAPAARGVCSVPGCEGELHCRGLCFRHERCLAQGRRRRRWRSSSPGPGRCARPRTCLVAGCDRERISRRGLCRFHGKRLQRREAGRSRGRSWPPGSPASGPGSGRTSSPWPGCRSCCASSCFTRCNAATRHRRRWTRPQVRILLSRLGGAASLRERRPAGGLRVRRRAIQLGPAGLFRDLRRHLDRAWAQLHRHRPVSRRRVAGGAAGPALQRLPPLAGHRGRASTSAASSRRWLREVVKDWARATRPYLQRLREALRACQAASHTLIAAGRDRPGQPGRRRLHRHLDAISSQRRADGILYSASHRNLMLYQFCQVIEHGRASGLMSQVPDPFRPRPPPPDPSTTPTRTSSARRCPRR